MHQGQTMLQLLPLGLLFLAYFKGGDLSVGLGSAFHLVQVTFGVLHGFPEKVINPPPPSATGEAV